MHKNRPWANSFIWWLKEGKIRGNLLSNEILEEIIKITVFSVNFFLIAFDYWSYPWATFELLDVSPVWVWWHQWALFSALQSAFCQRSSPLESAPVWRRLRGRMWDTDRRCQHHSFRPWTGAPQWCLCRQRRRACWSYSSPIKRQMWSFRSLVFKIIINGHYYC